MTTLDSAPSLPQSLPHEFPPNKDALIAQIEPWVIYLLRTTIESRVHYESQLHGPIGAFLEAIFLKRRRFMTIAQYMLREVVGLETGCISPGSTGGDHRSRKTYGQENNKLYPDYLTVKVVPRPVGAPRDYRIIAVLELKRNEDGIGKAIDQMVCYMNRIDEIASPSLSFRGFLVMGERVQVYEFAGYGQHRDVVLAEDYSMFQLGNRFTNDLAQVAIDFWN